MFNFYHNQNGVVPPDNNYCGAFSLAAIATALNGKNHLPMDVYRTVLNVQNTINNRHADVINLINRMSLSGSGTLPLLPSSFIRAHYDNFNYDIYLSQAVFIQAVQGINLNNVNNVINDETNLIGQNRLINVNHSLDQVLQNDHRNNHWLVLVNNATHWVAIDRDQNNINLYSIYNPAGAINDTIQIQNNQIAYNKNPHVPHFWSGIVVGVRK